MLLRDLFAGGDESPAKPVSGREDARHLFRQDSRCDGTHRSVDTEVPAGDWSGREIFRTQRENSSVAGRQLHVALRLTPASWPNQACSVRLSPGVPCGDQIPVGHRFRTVSRGKDVSHTRRKPWQL